MSNNCDSILINVVSGSFRRKSLPSGVVHEFTAPGAAARAEYTQFIPFVVASVVLYIIRWCAHNHLRRILDSLRSCRVTALLDSSDELLKASQHDRIRL